MARISKLEKGGEGGEDDEGRALWWEGGGRCEEEGEEMG